MSLTTTHAGPGGLLLTPIMWLKLCRHENIATGKYHFEVWSQVLTLRDSRDGGQIEQFVNCAESH